MKKLLSKLLGPVVSISKQVLSKIVHSTSTYDHRDL